MRTSDVIPSGVGLWVGNKRLINSPNEVCRMKTKRYIIGILEDVDASMAVVDGQKTQKS